MKLQKTHCNSFPLSYFAVMFIEKNNHENGVKARRIQGMRKFRNHCETTGLVSSDRLEENLKRETSGALFSGLNIENLDDEKVHMSCSQARHMYICAFFFSLIPYFFLIFETFYCRQCRYYIPDNFNYFSSLFTLL